MKEVKKQGMESILCPYEQALVLKELGFDEPCFGYYDQYDKKFILFKYFNYNYLECISAPLYQQVFRWFREKHNLTSSVSAIYKDENRINFEFWYYILQKEDEEIFYNTYEEAELACLNKLIEIIKNKQNEGI